MRLIAQDALQNNEQEVAEFINNLIDEARSKPVDLMSNLDNLRNIDYSVPDELLIDKMKKKLTKLYHTKETLGNYFCKEETFLYKSIVKNIELLEMLLKDHAEI